MASTVKTAYGTTNQTITITLASLGSTSLRESTAVDNRTNAFLDVLVSGKVTTGTSPSATGQINVYCYATTDDGTTYTSSATGSDAAYSPDTPQKNNLALLGVIQNDSTSNEQYNFGPWSVASCYGGSMPALWGVIFENTSGAALHATAGNHAVTYQGIHNTIV